MEQGSVNEPVQVQKVEIVLLHSVIAKQQTKRKQSHPVCLLAVEKYKKKENINTQNDYETIRKK